MLVLALTSLSVRTLVSDSHVAPCHNANRFEKKTGLVVRFVIGHSANQGQEEAVAKEAEKHGGFLRLPLQVHTSSFSQPLAACPVWEEVVELCGLRAVCSTRLGR